jgi:hypothetical protein
MAIICAQCGHRNPDGSRFCVNRDCGACLAWTGQSSGSQGQAPQPQPEPRRSPPRQGDATRWGYGAGGGGQSDVAASISLTDPTLSVQPGETVSTTVSVHNGGGQVEQFAIAVLGPTAGWAEIEPAVLAVYPDARGEAVIHWSPPRQSTTMAGQAPFTIRAASILHEGLQVHAAGVLAVGEFRELTATLTPQTTTGRWQTSHRIELTNAGNVVEPVQLKATDPAGRIRFSLPAGEFPVPPGSQAVNMSVRPPIRFLGKPASQPFQVLATPRPSLAPVRLDGTREIVPLIAGWIPKVVVGLVVLGVAAAAFLLARNDDKGPPAATDVINQTLPATAAPTAIPTGAQGSAPAGGAPGASASSAASPAGVNNTPWVVVGPPGTTPFGNGVSAVTTQGPGRFEVTFARNVSKCAYLATVAASGGQPVPQSGVVVTASGSSRNNVVVETRDIAGTPGALPFHLQVRCVNGDSAVVSGGRAVRGTDQPKVRQTEDGQWEIRFGRNIRGCAYVATIGDPGTDNPPTGLINVGSGQQDPAAVLVETRGRDGNRTDMPFHFQTRCSGLFAVVTANGQAARQEGVTEVRRTDPGKFEVDFKQDVSRCSYTATIGAADGSPIDIGGQVFAASGPKPASVQVQTRRLDPATGAGQLTDFPFHLQVVC